MLRRLTVLGVTRGLLGGNRRWLALGTAAIVFRVLGRMAVRQPETVFSERLSPGETLVIRHLTHHL